MTYSSKLSNRVELNSLHKSFEDTRSIKVLVIPIGENSLFDTHFDIISKFHCLPIYELNRPSNWKSTNKVFKYFDWNKHAFPHKD